jgi:hypothetical protein
MGAVTKAQIRACYADMMQANVFTDPAEARQWALEHVAKRLGVTVEAVAAALR